jgi:hypothetical protein
MHLRSESIQRWWPTTQSLDLVQGPVEEVAAAVHTEVKRFLMGEEVVTSWDSTAFLMKLALQFFQLRQQRHVLVQTCLSGKRATCHLD